MKRNTATLWRDNRHNITSALAGLVSCGLSEFSGPPFCSKAKEFWNFPGNAIAQSATRRSDLGEHLVLYREYVLFASTSPTKHSTNQLVFLKDALHMACYVFHINHWLIILQHYYPLYHTFLMWRWWCLDEEGKRIDVVEPVEWVFNSSVQLFAIRL